MLTNKIFLKLGFWFYRPCLLNGFLRLLNGSAVGWFRFVVIVAELADAGARWRIEVEFLHDSLGEEVDKSEDH